MSALRFGFVAALSVASLALFGCSGADFSASPSSTFDSGTADLSVDLDSSLPPPDAATPDSSAVDSSLVDSNATDTAKPDMAMPEAPPPLPCVGKPDGTVCPPLTGPRRICIKEVCEVSRCGDKFADLGEDCDDGNDKTGDGCEPTCKWSCSKNSDCDDKDNCNGTETCSSHTCKAGTSAADGSACLTPEGVGGVCKTGVCAKAGCGNGVVETGEECDDMNSVDNDGCGNDCKWNCKVDGDCSDGNVCNGLEKCGADHKCAPGTPLVCDDGNACTNNFCDATAGCKFTLIDADGDGYAPTSLGACGKDCDDGNVNIHPAATEICDGKDNNCNGMIDEGVGVNCYLDMDGDGFGSPASSKLMCSCSGGYVGNFNDCHDGNGSVKPGQTMWFTTPYVRGGTSTFDYNCNGVIEKQDTALGRCEVVSDGCKLTKGWIGEVPACGATGDYVMSCTFTGGATGCLTTTSPLTMGCH